MGGVVRRNNIRIKKLACVFVVAVICMFCLVMLSSCSLDDSRTKNLTNYSLSLQFDTSTKVLHGVEKVDYINSYDVPLSEVWFHLYPNAFRSNAKYKPVSSLTYDKAYSNGFSQGQIDIKSVVTSKPQNINIGGNDENILIVKLDDELFPDERVNIEIEFDSLLPNCNHRYGYGKNTYNFGNFYPIACVYEDGSFRQDNYVSSGDPFYSQMANYDVTIVCDSGFKLACTGEQTSTRSQDNITQTCVSANHVRDFAFVLSTNYQIVSTKTKNTTIMYYYYDDENAQKSLSTAVDAINTFSNLFGEYPYPTFSVAKTNFVHGGMEYPNLVYISDDVKDYDEYLNVIVHETAHQWWYNLVGSDAVNNAWQDEGLTEYSTLLFYKNNKGYNIVPQESLNASLSSYLLFSEIYESVYGSFDSKMTKNVKDFSGDMDYTYVTYVKGVLFFDSLQDLIGEKNFLKGLKLYFKQNEYKIASVDDMIACFELASKRNLKSFFDSWLDGKVILQDYNR